MSIPILIAEALIFAALFTAILFSTLGRKETAASIHNYPPDIQEEYFKTHPRQDVSCRSKKVILAKGMGLIVFIAAFGLMAWIGCYDTFFLDWVLFAHMECFRLPGTEHMDKAYRQKWFHLKGMLFPGIVFALIPAALVGWIITMLV